MPVNESPGSSSAVPPPLPASIALTARDSVNHKTAVPAFFPVSVLKLIVMSTVTFGIYQLAWFYWNWKYVRQALGRRDVMPFWRALFTYFFCLPLFREIRLCAASRGLTRTYHPGWCALGWVTVAVCWHLPDPYWFAGFLSPLALIPAQKVINDLNADQPAAALNRRFTAWNVVAIAIAGLLVALITIGTIFPEEPGEIPDEVEISPG